MLIFGLLLLTPLVCQAATNQVGLIKVDGPIGPATADYISRGTKVAADQGDACLILQLDTPGGLVSSTEEIIQSFYASQVPVVVYVAPSGASATSAGTLITLAGDIAAMAPNTRIGAAHPVSLLPFGGGESTNSIMKTKVENDLASMIRNIAEKRGRNAEWAETAVRESASITSEKALELNVIDLIAKDLPDLLSQLNGRDVHDRKLATLGAKVVEIPMVAREKVFQVLWRPEVMWILMLIAMYGIIGELSNPGAILPGVAGAIALILMLYMMTVLPVNIAGFVFIILAIALFIADVFSPTHGVLTAGGVISFALGALMLFNKGVPGFGLSLIYIIPGIIITALFFIFVVGAGLRAQFRPVKVGRETMIGKVTSAVDAIDAQHGRVFIEGEYWNAVSDTPIAAGQAVEIIGMQGLTLKVKPKA